MSPSFRHKDESRKAGIGQQQAERFRETVWPHLAMVLRSARYLTHHVHEAEDLAQDTLMKAMRAIDSFEEGTDVKAWLLTILRRTHIDRLRSRQHRIQETMLEVDPISQAEADLVPAPTQLDEQWADPEGLLEQFEDDAMIDALRSLPQDIRWTLMLVDIEQIDQAQAAALLDVPVGTIKSRAHRGRAMLRDHLHQCAIRRGWITTDETQPSTHANE